jgi:predicted transcriptional regulator
VNERRAHPAFRSIIKTMQVATVVTRGADESFVLTESQENELLASMAEIERGEYITLEELLQSLSKYD